MTAFNIRNFVSNISQSGTLQTNKFNVTINRPGLISSTSIGDRSQHLIYRAESVRIPGMTLAVVETRRYGVGPRTRIASNIDYTDISISFIEDAQGSVHKYFYRWMSQIFTTPNVGFINNNTYSARYKSEYTSTIIVNVFDNSGRYINTVAIYEAYPISLGDVQLSWSDNSSLMKINVTFAYTRWAYVPTNLMPTLNAFPATSAPPTIPSPTASTAVTPPSPQLNEAQIAERNLGGLY